MENKILKVPSYIKKVETTSDKGLKLQVYTQELAPEDITNLLSLRDKLGYFIFKLTNIDEEDLVELPKIKPEFKHERTPAEKLRAVLYIWWSQRGEEKKGVLFDDFYKEYLERIISQIKEKINP